MFLRQRLSLVAATAIALSACQSSNDTATLSISLGSALQALTLEGVTVTRFELEVKCVDGSQETVSGDVAEDGTFSAEVARCPQASLRFRGLTALTDPALAGGVDVAITQPSNDVVIPVRRVGTVTFVNDETYTSVCAVTALNAPEFDTSFQLAAGQSQPLVLPVSGAQVACAPADTCGSVTACNFDGPLAIKRAVAVPFGGRSTLSLANLGNSLVFTVGPPNPSSVDLPFGPFAVQLVDERNLPVARSDIQVSLVAESSTARGGFVNATTQLNAGLATFTNVGFHTAGQLTLHAEANVDGALLRTDSRVIDVLGGIPIALGVVAPPSIVAGAGFTLQIVALDQYSNPTVIPSALVVTSTDLQVQPVVRSSVDGILTYNLLTAGSHTVTVRSAADGTVAGGAQITVSPGAATQLDLSPAETDWVTGTPFTVRVTARDAYGNVDPSYRGTVSLAAIPVTGFTYGAPYTFTAADAGQHDFAGVTFASENPWTLSATDGTLVSSGVTVNVVPVGTLHHFVFEPVSGGPFRAGEYFNVTLRALDVTGGDATAYWDTVNIGSNGDCVGSFSFYGGVGVVSNDVFCRIAGSWPLIATDNAGHTNTSAPVVIVAGNPYVLSLVQDVPSTVLVGAPFSAAFRFVDTYGNTADPTGYTIDMVLSVAGPTLGGTMPVVVNGVVTYPALTVDTAYDGLQIYATANPANLEVNSTATSQFNVSVSSGCGTAYVVQSGRGTGCSPANAAGSIDTALGNVDNGGTVLIAAGTYNEHLAIRKTVTLRGGYDPTFSENSRNPLVHHTTVQAPLGQVSSIDATTGESVTLEGLLIAAPPPNAANATSFAVDISGGSSARIERNRIIGPLSDTTVDLGGVIRTDGARDVDIRNNWIHSGGATDGGAAPGYRDVIVGGTNDVTQTTVRIVHNTIYLAGASIEQVLSYAGYGSYSFTNNIVIGDFSTCNATGGVCVLREGVESASVGSVQNNMVLQLNSEPNGYYVNAGGGVYPDLNGPGGASYSGNLGVLGTVPESSFVAFGGFDTHSETMTDNDWHLLSRTGFEFGLDAQSSSCGSDARSACGGDGKDIDGATRTSPFCVGADELEVSVVALFGR